MINALLKLILKPYVLDQCLIRMALVFDMHRYKKIFYNWKAIEIGFEPVTKDGLIGYEIWRDE